jgi:hypothetical protein
VDALELFFAHIGLLLALKRMMAGESMPAHRPLHIRARQDILGQVVWADGRVVRPTQRTARGRTARWILVVGPTSQLFGERRGTTAFLAKWFLREIDVFMPKAQYDAMFTKQVEIEPKTR